MKASLPATLPALLALLPLALPAASPPMARHSWRADPSDARPASFRIPHGSAALIEARVPAAPAAASFHWQTNGMGSLWWEAPAEAATGAVSVVWTPAMDTGADDVRAFFRIAQEAGPDYSAFANLRLLHSPGAVPNALPLPARVIDFAEVAATNAPWAPAEALSGLAARADLEAVSNIAANALAGVNAVDLHNAAQDREIDAASNLAARAESRTECAGGYATPAPFWYPAARDEGAEDALPDLVREGDVLSAYGGVGAVPDKRLYVALDNRPMDAGGAVPDVEWEQTGGEEAATLDGDLLRATGEPGLAYVRATDGSGLSRTLAVPFAARQMGNLLQWGAADATNTWRDAVDRFVHGRFAAVDTNAFHVYRWCRDTVFGPSGSSTWTAPDALQLYLGTGAGAWDDPDPQRTNGVFFAPALGDALRCFSTPRGDWYAHRPYVAIAPHYILAVRHWSTKDGAGWTRFCTNRAAQAFQRVTFPAPRDERVAEIRDVTVHRTDEALPADICVRFIRNRELRRLSPSYFQGGTFITVTTHNTVHPLPLAGDDLAGRGGGNAGAAKPWEAFAERAPLVHNCDPDGRLASLHHLVHRFESGHPVFLWVPNGRLALAGTWTYSAGGPNAFFADDLVDRIRTAVETDSGGAETILEWSAEDLR